MTRQPWDVVPYSSQYRDAVLALMWRVQGHQTSVGEFIWEFEQNPTFDLNIQLAMKNGAVIGVACHSAHRMVIQGRERLVSFPLNVLTDPAFRGQGVFSTLEVAAEEHAHRAGASMMLSFPNSASTPIFTERLGWRHIAPPRLIGRMRAPGLATSRALKRLGLAPRTQEYVLERVGSFGSWADELWEANRETLGWHISRSSGYLNWRFVDRPTGKYQIYVALRDTEVTGYFVVGATVKRNIGLTYMASALASPQAPGYFRQQRSAVLRQSPGSLATVELDLTPTSMAMQSRDLLYGFLPVPKRLNLIYKTIGDDLSGSTIECAPWCFQLGDLDFF